MSLIVLTCMNCVASFKQIQLMVGGPLVMSRIMVAHYAYPRPILVVFDTTYIVFFNMPYRVSYQ